MNELAKFDFKGNQVRTLERNGEQWWIASDVCAVLEIRNSRQALSYLDEDEKGVITNDSHSGQRGGAQSYQLVNESGLYSLILRSRKPQAKEFKRWITHEVLPAIRKDGGYISPDANEAQLESLAETIREQATELAFSKARVKSLEAGLSNIQPSVHFGVVSKATKLPRTDFRRSYWQSRSNRKREVDFRAIQLLLRLFGEATPSLLDGTHG